MILGYVAVIIIGFSSGVIVSAGVFSFLTVVGVINKLAQKSHTQRYITLYENVILFAALFSTMTMIFDFYIPIGEIGTIVFGLFQGIFIGCVAVALAELLDVMPILGMRLNIKRGMSIFVLSIAIGKLVGSLIYWVIPGFYMK